MTRAHAPTRPIDEVVQEIINVLEQRSVAQVPGYKTFRFIRTTPSAVIIEREVGSATPVPKSDLAAAIEFVRSDHSAYVDGPGRLRECGITHVTSPTWALIRLLPLNDLIR